MLLKVVSEGADIESRGLYGRTPLMQAAGGGQLAIVKYLIETKGANVDAEDTDSGAKAIHVAAFGNVDTVSYLLGRRPDWLETKSSKNGRTPLLYAAAWANSAVVKYLIETKGANVEAEDSLSGSKAIHLAAQFGNVDTVTYLLGRRSDWLEVRSSTWGRTPLIHAAAGGNVEVVKYLIATGANIDAEDIESGAKAINVAVAFGNIATVNYLLERRPDWLDARSSKLRRTLLLDAAAGGNLEVLKYLIDTKNGSTAVVDANGDSALHLAAIFGRYDVAVYLASRWSDLKTKTNNFGQTPRDRALEYSKNDISDYLAARER